MLNETGLEISWYKYVHCLEGYFGPGCQKACHCMNGCECDPIVGCQHCMACESTHKNFPSCNSKEEAIKSQHVENICIIICVNLKKKDSLYLIIKECIYEMAA